MPEQQRKILNMRIRMRENILKLIAERRKEKHANDANSTDAYSNRKKQKQSGYPTPKTMDRNRKMIY